MEMKITMTVWGISIEPECDNLYYTQDIMFLTKAAAKKYAKELRKEIGKKVKVFEFLLAWEN